jgi:hypothetical protein
VAFSPGCHNHRILGIFTSSPCSAVLLHCLIFRVFSISLSSVEGSEVASGDRHYSGRLPSTSGLYDSEFQRSHPTSRDYHERHNGSEDSRFAHLAAIQHSIAAT